MERAHTKTKEERQKRRAELVRRIRLRAKSLLRHSLRPPDAGDVEAAIALGTALIVGAKDGYSSDEWKEISELYESLKEERADTP